MPKIIGISGRKQSGKGALAEFLIRNSNLLFPKTQRVQGFDNSHYDLVLDTDIQIFPMAAKLKEFAHKFLGLRYEQVYGTNEEKETLTQYRWEDMPMYEGYIFAQAQKLSPTNETFEYWIREAKDEVPSGLMTSRQVLQEVGTAMGRRFDKDLWCKANTRAILESGVDVALIDDIRFTNEVLVTQDNGGVVIRLTRAVFSEDEHASEKSLDGMGLATPKQRGFDIVVNNHNMSKSESCWQAVQQLMDRDICKSVRRDKLNFGD